MPTLCKFRSLPCPECNNKCLPVCWQLGGARLLYWYSFSYINYLLIIILACNCVHGPCAANGTCASCNSNWYGPTCNICMFYYQFSCVFIKFLLDCDAGSCSNHGGCSLNGSCNCNPNYYGTTCNTCMNSFVCLKSYSLQIVWTQTAEVVHAILQEHVPAMQTITNQIAQLVCSLQNSVLDILFTFL